MRNGKMKVLVAVLSLVLLATSAVVRCDDDVLNEDEVEAVTDLIEALKQETPLEFDLGNSLDDALEPYNTNSARSRKQVYAKYVYEHVPHRQLSKRAGTHQSRTEVPCDDETQYTEEHQESQHSHSHVGSLPGRAGIDFPNYEEIPLTSFTCAGKRSPGFYADVETNCQVFHVCYPHRRESFLCPVGTIFNQPILACDYWYNGNCTASSEHDTEEIVTDTFDENVEDLISTIVDEVAETEAPEIDPREPEEPPVTEAPEPEEKIPTSAPVTPAVPVLPEVQPISVSKIIQFLPVKAKVTKVVKPSMVLPMKAVKPLPVAKFVTQKVVKAKVAPVKAVPVAKLVKASTGAAAKTAVAHKLLTTKAKLAMPVVKPLVFKKAAVANVAALKKTKLAKAAAVPVISAATKKHLTAALLKMLAAQKIQLLNHAAVASQLHQY